MEAWLVENVITADESVETRGVDAMVCAVVVFRVVVTIAVDVVVVLDAVEVVRDDAADVVRSMSSEVDGVLTRGTELGIFEGVDCLSVEAMDCVWETVEDGIDKIDSILGRGGVLVDEGAGTGEIVIEDSIGVVMCISGVVVVLGVELSDRAEGVGMVAIAVLVDVEMGIALLIVDVVFVGIVEGIDFRVVDGVVMGNVDLVVSNVEVVVVVEEILTDVVFEEVLECVEAVGIRTVEVVDVGGLVVVDVDALVVVVELKLATRVLSVLVPGLVAVTTVTVDGVVTTDVVATGFIVVIVVAGSVSQSNRLVFRTWSMKALICASVLLGNPMAEIVHVLELV